MAFPWLRIVNTVLSLTDVALSGRRHRALLGDAQDRLAIRRRAGGLLEARLAGVVVAALREVFDRDYQRLELEREQVKAERERAERALRLELRRQAGDREISRLRLVSAVAVASLLGTLLFATRATTGTSPTRAALAIGGLLLLGSLAVAFAGQSRVANALSDGDDRVGSIRPSSGSAGMMAPWLVVAGLGVIAIGILLM